MVPTFPLRKSSALKLNSSLILQIPISTVGVRIKRGKEKIKSLCKDEKYENCSSDIKTKIDSLKNSDHILWSEVVRILAKYNEDYSKVNQEMFAVYNDFWVRVCSWIRNTSDSWKETYIQVR